jgi:cell fate regulator YaaT (PSP1 superfamily)
VSTAVEIRFKGNRKDYFTWSSPEPLRLDDPVIVEVERGQDLGWVSATGALAGRKCQRGCAGCSVDEAVAQRATHPIVRRASREDVRQAEELRRAEDDVRRQIRERVLHHALELKVSDAEWQWDRRKLTVYFTADQRVDFRALVRDLAARYHARIELRQIGARDEAKRLDGIGRCGRQLCIASWLPEPRPVSLSVAKDQHLSLNPTQISGPCGRLLCCLHYEHQFYVESRRRFPKEGKMLRTSAGVERVIAVDIFRDRVVLRGGEGDTRVVALEQLKREVATADLAAEPAPAVPPPTSPMVPAPATHPAPPRPRRRRGRPGPGDGARGA